VRPPRVAIAWLMLMSFTGSAAADEPPVGAPVDPPGPDEPAAALPEALASLGPARELVALTSSGGARVVARYDGAVALIDPSSGAVLHSVALRGSGLATADGAAFLCADDGLWKVDVSVSVLGLVSLVHPGACRGLHRVTVDRCEATFAAFDQELVPIASECAAPPPLVAVVPTGAPSRQRVDLPAVLGLEVGALRRPIALRSCEAYAGAAASLSFIGVGWRTPGRSWFSTGSPTVGASCSFDRDGPLGWIIGIETSPALRYQVDRTVYTNGLVGTGAFGWRGGRGFLGAHVLGGITVGGFGATGRWTVGTLKSGARHGPELRFTVMPSRAFVGQAQLTYALEVGRYRR
jgi:hypothetical protein